MPPRLSGVDAISPALERTKRQLFMPFNFGYWLRLATLCLLTGDLTGGGPPSGTGGLHLPARRGQDLLAWAVFSDLPEFRWAEFLPWVIVGLVVLFALAIVFVYVASVFRFVLFETVVSGRCELMAGWRRWQRQGSSYFLWLIGFAFATFAVMAVVVGLPLFAAWQAGFLRNPGGHVALLILGAIVLILVAAAVILASAVGALFAKDFVVPIMALEDVGVLEGWRRLFPKLSAEPGAYAIYVLMKIVLAVGSAILFAVADFLVVFAVLIPVGIAAVIAYLVGSAAGLTWNTFTISLAAIAGGALLTVLLYVVSFVSAPAMVFFQAYALHFFGSRYPRLGEQLSATSPEPRPSPFFPPAAGPLPAT